VFCLCLQPTDLLCISVSISESHITISPHRAVAFSCIYNATCSCVVRYVVSAHRSVVPVDVAILVTVISVSACRSKCCCGATEFSCQGRLLAHCPRPYGLEHPYFRRDYIFSLPLDQTTWSQIYGRGGGYSLLDRTVELLIILALWRDDRNNILALIHFSLKLEEWHN